MATGNPRIAELLAELQKEGATVKIDAKEGSQAGTALTQEAVKNMKSASVPFDAWISWTKRI